MTDSHRARGDRHRSRSRHRPRHRGRPGPGGRRRGGGGHRQGRGGEDGRAAVAAAGRRSLALATDVGDVARHRPDGERAIAEPSAIDVLVNNAGVTRRAYIMDLTEADWDRIMRVNGKGVFFCLQRVAREMIPRAAASSSTSPRSPARATPARRTRIYAGSKGAVIGMTRIAALQLARHNINVNAICPGSTVTALSNDNLTNRAPRKKASASEDMERRRNAGIPLGRPTTPRTSPPWPCSWPRRAPATSPASPSTWTAAHLRLTS